MNKVGCFVNKAIFCFVQKFTSLLSTQCSIYLRIFIGSYSKDPFIFPMKMSRFRVKLVQLKYNTKLVSIPHGTSLSQKFVLMSQ